MKAGLDSLKRSVNAKGEKQLEKIMGVSRKCFRRFAPRIFAKTRPVRSAKNAPHTSKGVPVQPRLIWINTAVPIASKLVIMQLRFSGTDIRE